MKLAPSRLAAVGVLAGLFGFASSGVNPWLARAYASPVAVRSVAVQAEEGSASGLGFLLAYRAEPECASRDIFLSQVASRIRERPSHPEPQIEVSIVRAGGQYRAELRLARVGEPTTSRELSADDCEEAASAMAVVAALALDALTAPQKALPNEDQPQAAPVVEPASSAEPWLWGVGAGLVIDWALAPDVTLGGSAFSTVSFSKRGPNARLGVSYRENGAARASGRRFGVRLLAVTAEVCPVEFSLNDVVLLAPCVGWLSGQYTAQGGRGFTQSNERSLFWNAGAAIARGRIVLGAGWSWEASSQLSFPLATRLSLVAEATDSGETIPLFGVSPVSAELGTAFRLEFP